LIINFKKQSLFLALIPPAHIFSAGILKIHYVIIISGYKSFPVIRKNLIGTASNLNTVYCLHKNDVKIYKLIIFLTIKYIIEKE